MLFFSPDPAYRGAPCTELSEDEREIFHQGSGNGYKKALKICATCPQKIRDHCLDQALEFEYGQDIKNRHGVWGGTTALKRFRMEQGAA